MRCVGANVHIWKPKGRGKPPLRDAVPENVRSAVLEGGGRMPTLSDGQSMHKNVGPLAALEATDNGRWAASAAQTTGIGTMP